MAIHISDSLDGLLKKGLSGHRLTATQEGLLVITEYIPPEFSQQIGKAILEVYGSGIYDAPVDQLGISHCLEHMLVERSAGDTTGEEFITFSDRNGAALNAQVFMRRAKYWASAPNRTLLVTLSSFLEQFFNASILETEVIVEKGSMRDEVRRIGSTPDEFCKLLANGLLFDTDPFSFTETGTEAGIDNITYKSLMEFRKTHYIPQHMTLLVSGSVRYNGGDSASNADRFHADVLDRVSRYVNLVPGNSISRVISPTFEPVSLLTESIHHDEHLDIPDSFYVRVRQNGEFRDDSREGLAIELFTRILDRRMFNTLRMRLGLTYDASCDYLISPEGLVVSKTSFHHSARDKVLSVISAIEKDLIRAEVPVREFEVQLSRLINEHRRDYRDGTSIFLRNRDMRFGRSTYEDLRQSLKELTPVDTHRAAKYILGKPYSGAVIGK